MSMWVAGWHFCADRDGKPVLRDGSPCPHTGETERYEWEVELCISGLHWSPRAIDALSYAQGPWVRRVEGIPIAADPAKCVGRERRTLAGPLNVERELTGFAGLCTLRAIRKYPYTSTRDHFMPAIKRAIEDWRDGVLPNTNHPILDIRRDARWSASLVGSCNSTLSEWSAARELERIWQNRVLEAMLMKALQRAER